MVAMVLSFYADLISIPPINVVPVRISNLPLSPGAPVRIFFYLPHYPSPLRVRRYFPVVGTSSCVPPRAQVISSFASGARSACNRFSWVFPNVCYFATLKFFRQDIFYACKKSSAFYLQIVAARRTDLRVPPVFACSCAHNEPFANASRNLFLKPARRGLKCG